jgi:hypothetical protein
LADAAAGICGSRQHVDFKRVIQAVSGPRDGPLPTLVMPNKLQLSEDKRVC